MHVGEVWFWREGPIEVYVLQGAAGYRAQAASAVLSGLDVALLASFLERPTMTQAVRAFREALRSRSA